MLSAILKKCFSNYVYRSDAGRGKTEKPGYQPGFSNYVGFFGVQQVISGEILLCFSTSGFSICSFENNILIIFNNYARITAHHKFFFNKPAV